MAEALERARGEDKALLESAWRCAEPAEAEAEEIRTIILRLGIEERCRQQLESWKEAAVRTLPDLRNPSLKGLLRRLDSQQSQQSQE